MLKADIELDIWHCYFGFSANVGSMPEKVPPLFKLASNVLFGDINAIEKYLAERKKGDYYFDARCGIHFGAKTHLGFIISNITNRYYSFRPGKPESPRSYTVQFRYDF
jgi:hypothetical protein